MKFEDTYLNDNILDALYDMRFEECTPIQERCIPEILNYHDLIGIAQTGTGKTAAYLLPILSMLDDGGYPKDAINCIIMSPTRELAQQIDQAMQGFGYYLNDTSSVAVYGGNDGTRYDQEMKSLRLGADVPNVSWCHSCIALLACSSDKVYTLTAHCSIPQESFLLRVRG